VTRKFNKNFPIFGNVAKNCSQNIKAQIESPKNVHTAAFNIKISAANQLI
jgi:hypothetical protein